ncbi:uncharacterized protein SCHCODRAFT_02687742 [Schizophyllum commune H4-8]|nr:uncharacterized protein SCHCODRAFT_02687742 [Schizophyllum commune H4-8]KAI5893692.1 hypothetical protein SCHCODRAFT_02687742 [Schizophyllum commune H4-8]
MQRGVGDVSDNIRDLQTTERLLRAVGTLAGYGELRTDVPISGDNLAIKDAHSTLQTLAAPLTQKFASRSWRGTSNYLLKRRLLIAHAVALPKRPVIDSTYPNDNILNLDADVELPVPAWRLLLAYALRYTTTIRPRWLSEPDSPYLNASSSERRVGASELKNLIALVCARYSKDTPEAGLYRPYESAAPLRDICRHHADVRENLTKFLCDLLRSREAQLATNLIDVCIQSHSSIPASLLELALVQFREGIARLPQQREIGYQVTGILNEEVDSLLGQLKVLINYPAYRVVEDHSEVTGLCYCHLVKCARDDVQHEPVIEHTAMFGDVAHLLDAVQIILDITCDLAYPVNDLHQLVKISHPLEKLHKHSFLPTLHTILLRRDCTTLFLPGIYSSILRVMTAYIRATMAIACSPDDLKETRKAKDVVDALLTEANIAFMVSLCDRTAAAECDRTPFEQALQSVYWCTRSRPVWRAAHARLIGMLHSGNAVRHTPDLPSRQLSLYLSLQQFAYLRVTALRTLEPHEQRSQKGWESCFGHTYVYCSATWLKSLDHRHGDASPLDYLELDGQPVYGPYAVEFSNIDFWLVLQRGSWSLESTLSLVDSDESVYSGFVPYKDSIESADAGHCSHDDHDEGVDSPASGKA